MPSATLAAPETRSPSCHQKRVLLYGAWVEAEVLEPAHRQYVSTIPKIAARRASATWAKPIRKVYEADPQAAERTSTPTHPQGTHDRLAAAATTGTHAKAARLILLSFGSAMSSTPAASGVTLEDFRPEHRDELVAMWRESFEHGVGIKDPNPLEAQRRYLIDVVEPNNTLRVAFQEGRIVGFVAASKGSIAQLYVRKGFHRRGIGSRLLEWAKEQSSGSLRLFTFERNAVARAFYEAHGFRIVGRGFERMWLLDDLTYQWVR